MAKNWTDRLPDLLQDYQEAPPEGLWDAVQTGMVSHKRRIPAAVWYVAGGLAAAAAVALLLFLRPSAPAPSVTLVPGDLAKVVPAPETLIPGSDRESPAPEQEMADQVGHDGTPVIPGSDRESPPTPKSDPIVPKSGTIAANNAQNDTNVPENGTIVAPEQEMADQVGHDDSPATVTPGTTPGHDGTPVIPGSDRESPRLRLRATLASSGVQQYASATTQGYGLPSGIITKSSGPQDAPDYRMLGRNKPSTTDTRYSRLPRWALGVNIGLPFRFSLETGLVLSPLRTTTAAEVGSYHYETRTDQYYLGIPLHLQYSIWEGRYLGVYASGGPMYQFAVATRARTTTTPLSGGNTQTIAEDKTLCKDALWSADLALGLQLRLFQRSALFVQPGVTWYFPGPEAPQSLYTEQRMAFELTFGYRVQLF
jgi:hypothetical protein